MAVKWNIDVKRTDNGYYCAPECIVPMQIRSPYSDLKVAELAEEMYRDGKQKDPVTVRRINGAAHILDGNRRLAAIKHINAHLISSADAKPWQVWFVVQEVESELDAVLTAATLNATMAMNPIDRAHMFSLALREGSLTQEQLAQRIGKTAAHVSQHLSLLRLGEAEQRAIAAGKIGFSAALDLLGLPEASREQVVAQVAEQTGPVSGQEVKALVAAARKEASPGGDASTPPSGGAGGKLVVGLGGLRKAFSALAEKDSTFLPIANVVDSFLRGQMGEDDLADEWQTFVQKLLFDHLEKLKSDGLVPRFAREK